MTTNDPERKLVNLTLAMEVVRAIEVTPADPVALSGVPGEIAPRELTLSAVDGKPFDITTIIADPRLDVSSRPSSPSARHQLTIKAKPDLQPVRTMATVAVKTSHPRAPQLPIRVTLTVLGPVEVQPERVLLRPSLAAPHVKITRRDGRPLAILGVESSDPELKASARHDGAGHDLAIEYTGRPGRPINARVSVKTDEPRQPTIVIPVMGQT